MEFKGTIIATLPVKSGTSKAGKPWSMGQYVIESEGEYKKKMCFDVFGEEKIREFDIRTGEKMTVKFDIDSNEYNGRWYNSIRAYAVEKDIMKPQTQAPAQTHTDPDGIPF